MVYAKPAGCRLRPTQMSCGRRGVCQRLRMCQFVPALMAASARGTRDTVFVDLADEIVIEQAETRSPKRDKVVGGEAGAAPQFSC